LCEEEAPGGTRRNQKTTGNTPIKEKRTSSAHEEKAEEGRARAPVRGKKGGKNPKENPVNQGRGNPS